MLQLLLLLSPLLTTAFSFTTNSARYSIQSELNSSPPEFFLENSVEEVEDYSYFSDENLKGYFHREDGNPENDPLKLYAPEEAVQEEQEDQYEA